MIRIKICGVTQKTDVELALQLGVDALGFNFVPGTPRALEMDVAVELSQLAAGRSWRVGVFRDAPLARILEISKRVELDCIQLHGDEGPDVMQALELPVIKAIKADPAEIAGAGALPDVDLLLDHPSGGGSGRGWDFSLARELGARGRRVWIAGGLGPENVGAAIEAARPYGVDVCSGIEARPGIKDPERMRQFVAEIRAGSERSRA